MSVMISLRDMRLSNTTGHCVLVKAQTPTMIPSPLREEAIMAGMIDTDQPIPGEEEEAAAVAPRPEDMPSSGDISGPFPVVDVAKAQAASEPVPTPPETVEAPAVIEDTGVDDAEALSSAIRKILVRNDPTDFKNDGTPKVAKVTGEMPPECKRPTATQVFAEYEKLMDDPDLAITD